MLLKDYLKERGITAYAYAKEMNTSPNAVTRWINSGWMVFGDKLVSPKRKTVPIKDDRDLLIEKLKKAYFDECESFMLMYHGADNCEAEKYAQEELEKIINNKEC